ncbi:MAG: 5-methylcytosine restriction system specificity protein McrC [Candidatus Hodarchaeales archaeon]
MEIPILNIYYLLSYAWDKLEESERVKVNASDYNDSLNLLARILLNGCNVLFKRGLERSYVESTDEYVGIKGKIEFDLSLRKNVFKQGKSICTYDQFEPNILINQILKATLKKLTFTKGLEMRIKEEAWKAYYRFKDIDDIDLQIFHFSLIRIHRNNSFYDFLLRVSRLIIEQITLSEDSGEYLFTDFTRNDKAMAFLFQSFVKNFYKKEQIEYRVSSPKIYWDYYPIDNSNTSLIPEMNTDIVLESKTKKIVIDTKFYKETLGYRFKDIIHAENLYQIYSYLRNLEIDNSNPNNKKAEGLLLYPTVQREIREIYMFGEHRITIATINLQENWNRIHNNLINIIDDNS